MKGINKTHEVNIFINDVRADIFSQDSLNLRFNNTFADPSKISTIQTEYTFSFTLPITKTNDKIFDYANILSKRNKFNKRFKTHVNVDGILIFDGELILQSVNKEGYKCNLYINRLNTIDKIFGDTTLNQITNWKIPYNQNETINNINSIEDINYDNVQNLASEARQKLKNVYPTSIGQALRISGVNPADISILMVYLRKKYNE